MMNKSNNINDINLWNEGYNQGQKDMAGILEKILDLPVDKIKYEIKNYINFKLERN